MKTHHAIRSSVGLTLAGIGLGTLLGASEARASEEAVVEGPKVTRCIRVQAYLCEGDADAVAGRCILIQAPLCEEEILTSDLWDDATTA
ncbi:MAG: hypothetical protein HYV07_34060 [Deltaproteobacteria bacterium]|nr:hypothetical protein [Deltaproteobacteria bacterium]